jgi:hypothetical protein
MVYSIQAVTENQAKTFHVKGAKRAAETKQNTLIKGGFPS